MELQSKIGKLLGGLFKLVSPADDTLTSCEERVILSRKRTFDDVLEEEKQFEQDLQHTVRSWDLPATLKYEDLPIAPFLQSTKLRRFNTEGKHVNMITRRAEVLSLEQFLWDNYGKCPAVCVQGPQGMGKSHCLYNVVCSLRSKPNNRVIYMPDCAQWPKEANVDSTEASTDFTLQQCCKAVEVFLKYVLAAFPYDKDIHTRALEVLNETNAIMYELAQFMVFISTYCEEHGLYLFGIFDQHHGLTDSLREKQPFKMIEDTIPTIWNGCSLCVISASANNSYFLKDADRYHWPQYNITTGFTKEELKFGENVTISF